MARPTRVPTHTCSEETINWGGFQTLSRTSRSGTYLFPQLLVNCGIMFGTQLLTEEREENGDDDSGLDRLAEDDEEDGDGEDVRHRAGDASTG
jgi:hypothetical protein